MINVGLVVTGFDKGGLEQVVYNLYREYKKKGINAYILCEKEEQAGYFIGLLDDVRDFCIFKSDFETFISYCYKKRITHLHYHYNTCFMEQASKCGIKVIYTIHNVYTWFNDRDISYRAEQLRYCDEIVAVSSVVKDYFCHRSGLPTEFVKVIPNGIELHELNSSNTLPENLSRKSLDLEKDDIVFAQLASFTPVKHQIGLIGVMEKLIEKNPKAKLLIVGNVLDRDYYNQFIKKLKNSPAENNIKIIQYFDHRFVGNFLKEIVDCAVLATLQEGCSNFVIEAICTETPIILTDVGNAQDVKEIVSRVVRPAYGDNKYVQVDELHELSINKECCNTDEIVNAMMDYIENIDAYKAKARVSELIKNNFSSETMAKKYIELM